MNIDNENSAYQQMAEAPTTAADLIAELDRIGTKNKDARKVKTSALGQFLKFSAAAGKSVDAAFGSDFDANRAKFLESKTAVSDVTKGNLGSELYGWHDRYVQLIAAKAKQSASTRTFTKFADALTFCFEAAQEVIPGLTMYGLGGKTGLKNFDLRAYLPPNSSIPGNSSLSKIQRLEEYLIDDLKIGISRGTLTAFVPEQRKTLRSIRKSIESSPFGKFISERLAARKKDPIRLNEANFPTEGLGKEFSDFVNYKSTQKISDLGLARDPKWVWILRPRTSFSKPKWWFQYICEPQPQKIPGQPTLTDVRYAPNGTIVFGCLLNYFGVLNNLGYDREKFSLVYLCDPVLVGRVLDYLLKLNGKLTTTERGLIAFITQLMTPVNGYVWQQPVFAKKLLEKPVLELMAIDGKLVKVEKNPETITKEEWHKWCEEADKEICKKVAKLEGDSDFVEKSRDSLGEVMEFLNEIDPDTGKKNPMLAPRRLADGIKAEIEKLEQRIACYSAPKPGLLQSLYRLETGLLFSVLLSHAPLRVEMYYKMSTKPYLSQKPDGRWVEVPANLYQRPNGQWAIRFPWWEFKNWRHVAKKDYDVGLPPLNAMIRHFLDDVRPYIDPEDTRKHLLFIAGKSRNNQKETRTTFLQSIYSDMTASYMRKEGLPRKALRPHSGRHFAASKCVLDDPQTGFKTAADILHDDPETVREFYSILVAEPGSDVYHGMIAGTFGHLYDKPAQASRKEAGNA